MHMYTLLYFDRQRNRYVTHLLQIMLYVEHSAFDELETRCPGTPFNNCSYNLWQRRYIDHQGVLGANAL